MTCRLEDVLDPRWKLSDRAEPVEYRGDPRPNLIRHGATAEDLCFLVTGEQDGVWIGQRLELNAFTGPQFVEWLGERLTEEGVGKVLPDEETLALAWRRTHFLKRVEEASAKFVEEVLARRRTISPSGSRRGRPRMRISLGTTSLLPSSSRATGERRDAPRLIASRETGT